jgi:hypothetical protein
MRLALCLLAVGCQVAPPVRLERPSDEVLNEIRAAVGADALFAMRGGRTFLGRRSSAAFAGGADLEGGDTGGEDGPTERPIALSFRPAGPFLLTIGAGEGDTARGFDGADVWTQDGRGVTRRQALGAREHLLADGWLRTSLWLTPGLERFEVTVDEARSSADEIVLDLARTGEPLRATLRVDRATRRPASYSIERVGRTRSVSFDAWAEEDGAWFPMRMTESVDGVPVHVDVFDRRTAGTPRSFAPPRSQPTDVSFDESALDAARSGELGDGARVDRGGRFYARVTLEGRGDVWMLLDTGFGSHAISPRLADELDLPRSGSASLSGVGGAGRAAWRSAGALTIGGMTLLRPRFVELDASFLSERAGFEVDGVLGAPLFERAVVVLDDRRGTIAIRDPLRFRSRGLEWQPVLVDGTAPCIRGRLLTEEGETPPLWFRLDTGSDDTLTVARWAVRRYGLEGDRSTLSPRSLVGPFGEALGWRKTAEALEISGAVLRRERVTLLREDVPGPLSDPWIAGNVGTRSLQGRRVVLDLSRRRIWIDPDD